MRFHSKYHSALLPSCQGFSFAFWTWGLFLAGSSLFPTAVQWRSYSRRRESTRSFSSATLFLSNLSFQLSVLKKCYRMRNEYDPCMFLTELHSLSFVVNLAFSGCAVPVAVWAFCYGSGRVSSCGAWGHRAAASPVAEHGLWGIAKAGAGARGPAAAVLRLECTGSRCG